jgi:alpha-beta hydrolase superfamily lysophospholipase
VWTHFYPDLQPRDHWYQRTASVRNAGAAITLLERAHLVRHHPASTAQPGPLLHQHATAEEYPGGKTPIFIGGQSLGGLIAASAALTCQGRCAGLVLTSPAIDVDKNFILRVQGLLASPLAAAMPWVRAVPAVKTELLSEDPEVRHAL